MTETIQEILDFWFGVLDAEGDPAPSQQALWFQKNDATDQLCRQRFGADCAAALAGDYDHWPESDEGLLALIILLDQLPRNIHRGAALAFSGDNKALELATAAIAAARHRQLPNIHRVFLYLPLEHCEDNAVQEQSVRLFSELASETEAPMYANFLSYAEAHRDVIARFGRFPHRNEILGRPSSNAEKTYLAEHGGF